jgi:hypothetical protein
MFSFFNILSNFEINLAYMSEERANCTVREKESIKINLMIGEN